MATATQDSPPRPDSKGDTRPVPDPTALTTDLTRREIAALKELAFDKIGSVQELLQERINGIDKATIVRLAVVDKMHTELIAHIDSLRLLHEERFKSIATQFQERDVRTEQTARDSKVAVDAALQAAKEAVGEQNKSSGLAIAKSEAATTKQIDQQSILIATGTQGLNDKIDDIKQRLTQIEGRDVGKQTAVTTQQTSNSGLIATLSLVFGSLIGVAGLVIGLILHYNK